jgi:hypothetical protein
MQGNPTDVLKYSPKLYTTGKHFVVCGKTDGDRVKNDQLKSITK